MIYLDAFGLPTAGGTSSGGGNVDYAPVVSPTFRNATLGRYCRLDSSYNTIEFANNLVGAKSLRIFVASADSSKSGNISLTITIGSASTTVTVPVTATATMQTIALPSGDGFSKIVRNTSNSADTLSGVSAVITSMEVDYGSAS